LQSNGGSVSWVATSSLGITGGGGGTTYTAGDHLTLTGTDFDVDDDFLLNTGDTISGNLTFSGSFANIALGSNWLSGDGDDEGIFVDGGGNVGIGTSTPNTFKLEVAGDIGPDEDASFALNPRRLGSSDRRWGSVFSQYLATYEI